MMRIENAVNITKIHHKTGNLSHVVTFSDYINIKCNLRQWWLSVFITVLLSFVFPVISITKVKYSDLQTL